MTISRRHFLASSTAAAAVALLASRNVQASQDEGVDGPVILFQGDSITDCSRSRSDKAANSAGALGNGYPLLVASSRLRAQPEKGYRFFNRGVSGNKIPDLRNRWDTDTLALKPDVLSLLIGVNDYWHTRTSGYTGTLADYENGFNALIDDTRRQFPNVRVVIIEPFVLPFSAVDASWFPAFDGYRAAASRVARRAGATFVELQAAFTERAAKTKAQDWLIDGVHPTPAGHELIAERWMSAVKL